MTISSEEVTGVHGLRYGQHVAMSAMHSRGRVCALCIPSTCGARAARVLL